jgi:hypothetical protein
MVNCCLSKACTYLHVDVVPCIRQSVISIAFDYDV